MTALRGHFCRRQTHCCKHNALPVWSAYLTKRCWRTDCWGTRGWKALDKYKVWIYINSNTRHGISTKINCHLTHGWETERDLPRPRCATLAHKHVTGSKKRCMEQRRELEVMMEGHFPTVCTVLPDSIWLRLLWTTQSQAQQPELVPYT